MTQYARIAERSAYLNSDFGMKMAARYFSEEQLAALPVITRGKRKGMLRGEIVWEKVEEGGWVREVNGGHVERRVKKVISVKIVSDEVGDDTEKVRISWEHLPNINKGIVRVA